MNGLEHLFWTLVTIAAFPTSRAIIVLAVIALIQRRRRRPSRSPHAA